jgi:SAM-dependent methyltransferase
MVSPVGNVGRITFELSATAWSFATYAADVIRRVGARSICEVGGGANPLLVADFVTAERLEYVVGDAPSEELEKASDPCRRIVAQVGGAAFEPFGEFDLVVTKMVLEHVRDPRRSHEHVFELVKPGGRAVHFFPTLYDLPFVANRLLPERVLEQMLLVVQPNRARSGRERKFPAYCRWCRGPSSRQIARFASVGFEVEEYRGFYGHAYFQALPPLQRLEDRWAAFLARHPVPALTSFAWVRPRRPT